MKIRSRDRILYAVYTLAIPEKHDISNTSSKPHPPPELIDVF